MSAALREPTYFVLASLLDGPLHGYAIARRAAELSAGSVRLSTGTVYGALDRLAIQGLVTVAPVEVVNGRPRRSYSLTTAGRDALQDAADQLAQAVQVVRRLPTGSARPFRPPRAAEPGGGQRPSAGPNASMASASLARAYR